MVEIDALFLEVLQKLGVHPLYYLFHAGKGFLDAWPWASVVIQNAIEYLTETPIRISLHTFEHPLLHIRQPLRHLKHLQLNLNKLAQEHNQKRRNNIIDALHIPTRRMPDMPNIQYPTHIYMCTFSSSSGLLSFWKVGFRAEYATHHRLLVCRFSSIAHPVTGLASLCTFTPLKNSHAASLLVTAGSFSGLWGSTWVEFSSMRSGILGYGLRTFGDAVPGQCLESLHIDNIRIKQLLIGMHSFIRLIKIQIIIEHRYLHIFLMIEDVDNIYLQCGLLFFRRAWHHCRLVCLRIRFLPLWCFSGLATNQYFLNSSKNLDIFVIKYYTIL